MAAVMAPQVRRVIFECEARAVFETATRRERANLRVLLRETASACGLDEDEALVLVMEDRPFEPGRWPLVVLVDFVLGAVPLLRLLEELEDVDSRE